MINLSYTKLENAAKFIEVEVCNQESINNFVKEVGDANIYNKLQKNLNTNPNHNYEILSKHLLCAKLKHIPRKVKTRCTRGDASSFFCTYKTYLYA